MAENSARGEADRVAGRGLGAQFADWLDIHADTDAANASGLDAVRHIPFADWCCIPFVALVVIGDIAFQFWGG